MAGEIFNDIVEKKINSLYLYENVILMEGALVLAEYLKFSSVTELICNTNTIEHGAIQVLSCSLKHTKITNLELDFGSESIRKDDQIELAKGLRHTSITYCKISMKLEQEFIKTLALCLQDTKIQTLDLSTCEMSDIDLEILAPNLKKSHVTNMRLCWNNIGNRGAKTLAENLKYCKLEVLDLSGNKISAGVEAIAKKLKGSLLSTLILDKNDISSNGAEALSKYLTTSSITNLGLYRNGITDIGIKFLARGAEKSKITALNLAANEIHSSKSAKAVADCLKKAQILRLDLGRMELNVGVISVLSRSLPSSQLTHLCLRCKYADLRNWTPAHNNYFLDGLQETEAIELASGLKSSNITYLDLRDNKIGAEGAKAIAECLKFTRISHLNLSGNRIMNEGAEALAEELKFTEIAFLDLSENWITDEAAATLMENLKDTKVVHFDFSKNLMCEKGIKALGENIHKTRLQYLDLSYNKIRDESAALFIPRLKGTEVTYLALDSNDFGDAVLKALAETLKYTRVTGLDLGRTSFSDKGITALTEGLKGTHLTYLNLTMCKLGTEGVRKLGRCIKHTCIVHLILYSGGMYSETLNYLAFYLANTQLYYLYLCDHYIKRLFQETNSKSHTYRDKDRGYCDYNVHNFAISTYIRLRNTMFNNWKNAQYVVHLFKSLVSRQSDNSTLDFVKVDEESDAEEYVSECLSLLKITTDAPGMVAHIILDKDRQYTPEEIREFFTDIVNKFCIFVACRLEAKVDDYVFVLKICEELQLNDVVANLLLHRTLYTIETEKNILHPYAYELLKKYNQVMYQRSIEPQKKNIIMDYFKQHPEIEGAQTISDLFS